MKTFITLCFTLITFSVSAQQLAMADTRSKNPAPIMKEAYALNMQAIQKEIGYPEICRNAHLEGKVYMQVQTDAQGNYVSHRVQYASNKLFRKAVEKEIQALTFSPAYQNGQRIGTWVPVVFEFNLAD